MGFPCIFDRDNGSYGSFYAFAEKGSPSKAIRVAFEICERFDYSSAMLCPVHP